MTPTLDLTTTVVIGGTLATLLMGLAKTGLPPLGALGAAVIASVLPPVPAAGVALPLLIVGDLVAVATYGRDVRWQILRTLLPSVTLGLVVGFAALRWAPPDVSARIVGALLLLAGLGDLVRQVTARRAAGRPGAETATGAHSSTPNARERLTRATLGAIAGVSTMIANAGGPPMSLYLLRTGVSRAGLLGTVALFFLTVNIAKLPFSAGLGLVSADSLRISLVLLPGLVAGLLLGRLVAHRVSGPVFSTVVLVMTAVAGARLLVG
ncbi:TSUP family transporter [Promicromonospora sp. NPDC052451]|uniref:TSUP family transporter n=1 Tax=Promicromonospora sp. NPDC052451 TaxID=3364407 RepID=UPI0037CAF00F